MIRKSLSRLALVPAVGLVFGGWAVVTVDDLPDHVTVGEPITLSFTVRQHGVTLLGGLRPRVEARSAGGSAAVDAVPGTKTGYYTAKLTLPRAAEWTITVHSGFGNSKTTLLPLKAVDRAAVRVAIADAERGRRLFSAKGCVTCHVNADAGAEAPDFVLNGPELTGRKYPADYLAKFLADPSIKPATSPSAMRMPNLGLTEREIASLVAFINAEKNVSAK